MVHGFAWEPDHYKDLKKEQKVPLQSSKGRNNKFKEVEMKTDGEIVANFKKMRCRKKGKKQKEKNAIQGVFEARVLQINSYFTNN